MEEGGEGMGGFGGGGAAAYTKLSATGGRPERTRRRDPPSLPPRHDLPFMDEVSG